MFSRLISLQVKDRSKRNAHRRVAHNPAHSGGNMSTEIHSNQELAAALAQDPQSAEKAITRLTALQTDRWIYRIVVLALGFGVLSAMIGLIVLSLKGVTAMPEGLVAIGSAAVGALAGLLAPAPKAT
jgi:uncharacterized membrane protein YjjP (DUF1212 family)